MPITIQISGDNAAQAIRELTDLAGYVQPAQTSAPVGQAPATQPQAPSAPTSAGDPVPPVETISTTPDGAAAAPASTAAAPQPAPTAPVAPAAPVAAPTSAPQYDFNQLASATMQLQQAGQNIFEIFQQFGVQALNQLPKERYAEYAAALRQRGAKI